MIRNVLDNGNFACGAFIDLQKAFNTTSHDILLFWSKISFHIKSENTAFLHENNMTLAYVLNKT